MQPGEDHDIALPQRSREGLHGTIYSHPVYRSYPVIMRISVEASDKDEACLQVERLLAGRFDFDFVAAIETKGWAS